METGKRDEGKRLFLKREFLREMKTETKTYLTSETSSIKAMSSSIPSVKFGCMKTFLIMTSVPSSIVTVKVGLYSNRLTKFYFFTSNLPHLCTFIQDANVRTNFSVKRIPKQLPNFTI